MFTVVLLYKGQLFDRSGTEEEYNELHSLLEDIINYRRDMELQKIQQKEAKKRKIEQEKQQGSDMRKAALERMSSKLSLRQVFSSTLAML